MNFEKLNIIKNKNDVCTEFNILDNNKNKVYINLNLNNIFYKYNRFNNNLILFIEKNSEIGILYTKLIKYTLNNIEIDNLNINNFNNLQIGKKHIINEKEYMRIEIIITKYSNIFIDKKNLKYKLSINKINYIKNEILKNNLKFIKININKIRIKNNLYLKHYFYCNSLEINNKNKFNFKKSNLDFSIYQNNFFLKYNYNSNLIFNDKLKLFINLNKNEFTIVENKFLIKKEKINYYQEEIKNRFEQIYNKNSEEKYQFVFLNKNEEIDNISYTNLCFKRNIKNKKDKFIDNYLDSYFDNIYIINKNYNQQKINNIYSKNKLIKLILENDIDYINITIIPQLWNDKENKKIIFYMKIHECYLYINNKNLKNKSINYHELILDRISFNYKNDNSTSLYYKNEEVIEQFLLKTPYIYKNNIIFEKNKIKIIIKDFIFLSILYDIHKKINNELDDTFKTYNIVKNYNGERFIYVNYYNFNKIYIKLFDSNNVEYVKVINSLKDLNYIISTNYKISFELSFFIKSYFNKVKNKNINYLNLVVKNIHVPKKESFVNYKINV